MKIKSLLPLLSLLLIFKINVYSQSGFLDQTFGGTGIITTSTGLTTYTSGKVI